MASPITPPNSGSFAIGPVNIQEDSALLRTICCIPIFGTIASYLIESSLNQRWISATSDPERIELLHIKNQYKIVSVIRNLLLSGLMVASIAYKIIALTPLLLVWIPLPIINSGLHIYLRNQNIELIDEIETTGYKMNMRAR